MTANVAVLAIVLTAPLAQGARPIQSSSFTQQALLHLDASLHSQASMSNATLGGAQDSVPEWLRSLAQTWLSPAKRQQNQSLSGMHDSPEFLAQLDVDAIHSKLPESVRSSVQALKQRRTSTRVPGEIKCMAGDPVSRAGLLHEDKYAQRNKQGQCESGQGMWGSSSTVPIRAFKYMAMAKVLDLDPGDRVLDWGSGCGSELEAAVGAKQFHAVGVDVVQENVDFATKHSKTNSKYCLANGGSGLPFPENSFDAVISNAALYHVNGLANEQKAMQEVVRVLAPGGCAWMGWLGMDGDQVKMQDWDGAQLQHAVVGVVKEKDIWQKTEYGQDSYALIACKKK